MIPTLTESAPGAIPIWPVTKDGLPAWLQSQPPAIAAWVERCRFEAVAGRHLLLPDAEGGIAGVLLAVADEPEPWAFAGLPEALPEGAYCLDGGDGEQASQAALGWALGSYRFDRYRSAGRDQRTVLVWPRGADHALVERAVNATVLVRDLVNTPSQDMGPAELALAAESLAQAHGAHFRTIVGDDLLAANFPMIHAVGRASPRAPRLIDLIWGDPDAPAVTVVGKGICFDSGGLDIKPSSGMALMKKDMGGAATALGLALMVMDAGLKLRLRVLIPAAENVIAGNAFRPGDVLRSRRGLTVEIGNTDAEGRLVLADALTEADAEAPELLIDLATLTGAARVALGPDLPAMFTADDALAADLARHARATGDMHWRLPLHKPYRSMLDSKLADINNAGEGGFAGSVTAALFLAEFVEHARTWVHFDLYCWNPKPRPGRPVGGEAMAMRALYSLLAERYGPAAQ